MSDLDSVEKFKKWLEGSINYFMGQGHELNKKGYRDIARDQFHDAELLREVLSKFKELTT